MLHIYSSFVLLSIAFSGEELSPPSLRKFYLALVIDVLVVVFVSGVSVVSLL